MPSAVQWEGFLNGELKAMVEREHAPGAAILLVSGDDQLQFERTVGLARIDTEAPLQPDTPIRAGSISKVVAAIAVQQLVERGELDPDSPIETLIDWDLPYGYGRATTLDLLTHRAGIGERFARQSTPRAEEILNLDQFLRRTLPPPVAPVGETVTYSNFGISLAGLVVEKVSGRSFAEYARQEIFLRAGMQAATFVATAETERTMARGYNWIFGGHRLLPTRHWRAYPASSLVASPRELASLMRSLLQEGSPILLRPAALFEEQFTPAPGVPGMGLAFWLDEMREQRVAWHTGHMPGHRTGFYLFPDRGIGVVFYYNTDRYVLRSFLERMTTFAFGEAPAFSPAAGPSPDPRAYRGRYRHSWYPHHHFGKSSALLAKEGAEVGIRPGSHHLIGGGERLEHGQDEVFANLDQVKRLGFIRNAHGRITGFYAGGRDRYEKISLFETQRVSMLVLAACVATFTGCGALVLWEMLRGEATPPLPMELGLLLVSGTNLTFILSMALLAARGAYKLMEDLPPVVGLVLALPVAGAAAWLFVLGYAVAVPPQGTGGMATGLTLIAFLSVAELLFLSYLHYWKLLGWRY